MSKFTNSPLVTYTKLSPNHSGERTRAIDTITIHCLVGHCSLKTIGDIFGTSSAQASCNYAIDDDGNVGMYVEEKNRSWCTSSAANDQRAITIEVASDKTAPYKVTDKALKGLIELCADICKRNNIKKLLWKGDKNLIGQVDKQNMTVHRWFKNKECPGKYLYDKHNYIAEEVNKILNGDSKKPVAPDKSINTTITPYMVTITASSLNYRKGPGTNYSVLGSVRKGEAFTVVEESNGQGASKWGKLKSGAGWISLDHCQKR